MNAYYAYIRVSDPKQERGTSPEQQRDDIERYASRRGLTIARWFKEAKTAAVTGRPAFREMIRLLQGGKAQGVIFHKIDRSSRNRTEWAGLNDLFDSGVDVHFAHEGVDMTTRSGRVAADVQAMLAVNYIANLRDEVRKGQLGRLKQGLYPWAAPPGYQNNGEGQAKTVDPVHGPLARIAFELYASGRFNKHELGEEMYCRGLRMQKKGRYVRVTKNGIAAMLRNPFYIGLIHVRKWGETYPGAHEPLIPTELFERVQRRLDGKGHTKAAKHNLVFRRLVPCATCGRNLVGEIQKARYVYYRCHTQGCSVSVPEREIEGAVKVVLGALTFSGNDLEELDRHLTSLFRQLGREEQSTRDAITRNLGAVDGRLMRLTDAYLDGEIEKEIYQRRKQQLLLEQRELEEKIAALRENPTLERDRLRNHLELASTALLSYELGTADEKRELVRELTSNFLVQRRKVSVELRSPYQEIAECNRILFCGEQRTVPRTTDKVAGAVTSPHSELVQKLLAVVRARSGVSL